MFHLMRSVVSCSFDFHIADKRSHWAMAIARWHGKATDQRTPKQTSQRKAQTRNIQSRILSMMCSNLEIANCHMATKVKNNKKET